MLKIFRFRPAHHHLTQERVVLSTIGSKRRRLFSSIFILTALFAGSIAWTWYAALQHAAMQTIQQAQRETEEIEALRLALKQTQLALQIEKTARQDLEAQIGALSTQFKQTQTELDFLKSVNANSPKKR